MLFPKHVYTIGRAEDDDFKDDELEAQQREMICPRPQTWQLAEPDTELKS